MENFGSAFVGVACDMVESLGRIEERQLEAGRKKEPKEFLSQREFAALLGIRRDRVARLVALGKIATADFNGRLRIPRSELERLKEVGGFDTNPTRRKCSRQPKSKGDPEKEILALKLGSKRSR